MNFSHFFVFLNIIKTLHWTTDKHSHHLILDEAYNDFSSKIDEFVESCIGSNNVKKFENITIAFEIPDTDETLYIFESVFNDLLTAIGKYANSSEQESLIDDMKNIANKTIYLLKMK